MCSKFSSSLGLHVMEYSYLVKISISLEEDSRSFRCLHLSKTAWFLPGFIMASPNFIKLHNVISVSCWKLWLAKNPFVFYEHCRPQEAFEDWEVDSTKWISGTCFRSCEFGSHCRKFQRVFVSTELGQIFVVICNRAILAQSDSKKAQIFPLLARAIETVLKLWKILQKEPRRLAFDNIMIFRSVMKKGSELSSQYRYTNPSIKKNLEKYTNYRVMPERDSFVFPPTYQGIIHGPAICSQCVSLLWQP